MAEKQCSKCKETKPLEAFNRSKQARDGRFSYCRTCQREYNKVNWQKVRARRRPLKSAHDRLTRYGLTPEMFEEMRQSQSDRCAICKQPETDTYRGALRKLAVDHCHTTGEIRGLLCGNCNKGLGLFKDDPVRLRKAVEYLSCHLPNRRLKAASNGSGWTTP